MASQRGVAAENCNTIAGGSQRGNQSQRLKKIQQDAALERGRKILATCPRTGAPFGWSDGQTDKERESIRSEMEKLAAENPGWQSNDLLAHVRKYATDTYNDYGYVDRAGVPLRINPVQLRIARECGTLVDLEDTIIGGKAKGNARRVERLNTRGAW